MSVSYALNDPLPTEFLTSILVVLFSLIQSVQENTEKLMILLFFIYNAILNIAKDTSINDLLSSISSLFSIILAILTMCKKNTSNSPKN